MKSLPGCQGGSKGSILGNKLQIKIHANPGSSNFKFWRAPSAHSLPLVFLAVYRGVQVGLSVPSPRPAPPESIRGGLSTSIPARKDGKQYLWLRLKNYSPILHQNPGTKHPG